ncbi:MAG TPA: hypothetical protein P5056_01270 [Candidatus Paceibacterota bacterium]|nr:hypothetical protein [Candidatus Paceibacterota bacterium]
MNENETPLTTTSVTQTAHEISRSENGYKTEFATFTKGGESTGRHTKRMKNGMFLGQTGIGANHVNNIFEPLPPQNTWTKGKKQTVARNYDGTFQFGEKDVLIPPRHTPTAIKVADVAITFHTCTPTGLKQIDKIVEFLNYKVAYARIDAAREVDTKIQEALSNNVENFTLNREDEIKKAEKKAVVAGLEAMVIEKPPTMRKKPPKAPRTKRIRVEDEDGESKKHHGKKGGGKKNGKKGGGKGKGKK